LIHCFDWSSNVPTKCAETRNIIPELRRWSDLD
jgi:hypothetical protein